MTRPSAPPRRPPAKPAAAARPSLQDASDRAVRRLVDLLEHQDPRIVLSAARLLLDNAPEPERYTKIKKLRGGEFFRGGAEALAEQVPR